MRTHERQEPVTRMLRNGLIISACILGYGAFAGTNAQAQDEKRCHLIWSETRNKDRASKDFGEIKLRPNAGPKSIYLWVTNPTDLITNVEVELWSEGEPVEGTKFSTPLGGQETKAVAFTTPMPTPTPTPTKDPADKSAPAPAGDPKASWHDLKGPLEFHLFEIKDNTRKDLGAKKFSIDLASPADLVTIQDSDVTFVPASAGTKNKLSAKVAATDKVGKTPCEVFLEVSPRLIQGLKAEKPAGAARASVVGGQSVELVTEDLQFVEGAPALGYCCIWIDGRPGPVYQIDFRNGVTRRVGVPFVRLEADRYAQPGKYRIGVSVANTADVPGVKTIVGIDRNKNRIYEADEEVELGGLVDKRVRFSPTSRDNAILLQASAKEWVCEFNMADTVGVCPIRVRVSKDNNDERIVNAEGVEGNELFQPVTFDSTKPEDVKIEAPKQSVRGKPLVLTARGRDDESKVSKVTFFFGKPAGDKPPMGTELIEATAVDADRTVWKAELPLKPDQKLVDVSVQFTNHVGLSAFDSIKIELIDPDPPTTGNIKGKVVNIHGDAQEDTTVTLVDADKKQKGKAKTNEKGEFEFKDLPPGSYTIEAKRAASNNSGTTTASVAKGKTTEVKIEIKRF